MDIDLVEPGTGSVLQRLAGEQLELQDGERDWRWFYIAGGMSSGAPAVMLSVRKDDGTLFVCETSLRLLLAAADAFRAAARQQGMDL